MTELVGTVQQIKRQINPKLKIGGVFLTMANSRPPSARFLPVSCDFPCTYYTTDWHLWIET